MRKALEGEGVNLERVEERRKGKEGGMRQRRDNKESRPPPSKSGMAHKGGVRVGGQPTAGQRSCDPGPKSWLMYPNKVSERLI